MMMMKQILFSALAHEPALAGGVRTHTLYTWLVSIDLVKVISVLVNEYRLHCGPLTQHTDFSYLLEKL